ncbi:hypothetical protein Dimus_005175 [Dionaea muscipula]
MAHHLLLSYTSMISASQAGLAVLSLFLCAMALLLCASHTRKLRRRLCTCYGMAMARNETDPVSIMHLGGEEQQDSIWQKNILMGGKCQLPDFSGVIVYDSAGNLISSSQPSRPALPWK